MRSARYLYAGAVVVALVVGLGLWKPTHVKADRDHVPKFRVDASWPKELPAPAGYNPYSWPTPGGYPDTFAAAYGTIGTEISNGTSTTFNTTANRWVQGEVAGNATDAHDNIWTVNRAWEVGITVNGTVQNNESGNIVGNDALGGHALPSPPVVAFDPDGKTICGFGNPRLVPVGTAFGAYSATAAPGRPMYMPYGSHGVYVDYQGYLWTGGNGDGVVQKYNVTTACAAGASATPVWQVGTLSVCDTRVGPTGSPTAGSTCSATPCTSSSSSTTVCANNSSPIHLNEPPDIAVDPNVGPVSGLRGDVYIADGYGNARVVVFNPALASAGNPDGYVGQWGTSCGFDENQVAEVGSTYPFTTTQCPFGTFGTGAAHPHCVVLGNDGLIYVCDRPNSRIQVFSKTCASFGLTPVAGHPGTYTPPPAMLLTEVSSSNYTSNQPVCQPERVIYVSNFPDNFPTVTSAKVAATLNASTRAADFDFYPNVDYLADQSPTHQKYGIVTDLDGSNNFLFEKPTSGTGDVTATTPMLTWIGRDSCGFGPCPGHYAGEFSYSHTNSVDSRGNVYVAEVITGRRVQKFVPVDDDDHNRDHH